MEDLKKLKNYAKLAVEIGANLQKGQPAMIISLVETADFAQMLAECAYEAGASNVIIYWRDEKLARLKLQYESKETLAEVPAWQKLLEDT